MKWVLYLLVLANAAFFAWQYQLREASRAAVEAREAAGPAYVTRLVLLSELADTAGAATPAGQSMEPTEQAEVAGPSASGPAARAGSQEGADWPGPGERGAGLAVREEVPLTAAQGGSVPAPVREAVRQPPVREEAPQPAVREEARQAAVGEEPREPSALARDLPAAAPPAAAPVAPGSPPDGSPPPVAPTLTSADAGAPQRAVGRPATGPAAVGPSEPTPPAPAPVASPAAASPSPPVPVSAGATREAAAASTGPVAAAAVPQQRHCYRVGPLAEGAPVDAVRAWLGQQGGLVQSRVEQRQEPRSYWVYIPPAASAAAAREAADRLQADGVRDVMRVSAGARANAISLGLYNRRAAAEQRVAELKRAGYAAEIETRFKEVRETWIDAIFEGTNDLPRDGFHGAFPQLKAAAASCR